MRAKRGADGWHLQHEHLSALRAPVIAISSNKTKSRRAAGEGKKFKRMQAIGGEVNVCRASSSVTHRWL